MKSLIYLCTFSLLAMALLAGDPAVGAEAPEQDPKATENKEDKPAAEAKETPKTPPAEPEKPASPEPATLTVKKGPFKIEVALDGVFEAQATTEIVLRPKAWSTLKVLKAVEHGAEVNEGELLLALDPEKIDKAIADRRAAQRAADVEIKLAQQSLKLLENVLPMNLAANQRSHDYSKEDLDYYFKMSRPMALRSNEFSLKSAKQYVQYQEEEVRQLEKMYKADDLTEETEEIILQRARNSLERARFSLEQSQLDYDQTLKTDVPRRDVRIKVAAKRIDLEWITARAALPLAVEKERLALEKLKLAQSKSQEKLEELLADRALMTVKSPAAGLVYYGKAVRGKFTSGVLKPDAVRPGAALTANSVLMTIVKPRPMFIRAAVAEKELQNVSAGIQGTAVPTGYPDMKLTAIVDRVAGVPTTSGSFDSRMTVALDAKAAALMPGMTCKVKLVPYRNDEAVTVPPKAVATDESDDQKHHVCLVTEEGERKKQCVKVGKRTAKQVEIIEGLSEGDKILAECPKDLK